MSASTIAASTVVDVLRSRATLTPQRIALTYLAEGDDVTSEHTYSELDERSRAVAAAVAALASPGDRALLLFPTCPEFLFAFFACLRAGVVPVPLVPPHPSRLARTAPPLGQIAADAGAALVLTCQELVPTLAEAAALAPTLALPTVAVDVPGALGDPAASPELGRDPVELAFLQYTSGSTAVPKGVMVRHRNLVHNLAMMAEALRHDETTVFVNWLPHYHDMGVIGMLLQPIYCGARCVFMPPAAFVQRPVRWLRAISRFRGSMSGGPNFAFDLCVRKVSIDQRAGLDLSCWTRAFNGAEPIRAETIDAFAENFAPCGFRRESFFPTYGLAEATLFASGAPVDEEPLARAFDPAELAGGRAVPAEEGALLVSVGRGWLDRSIAIVDPQSDRHCPEGELGEICLAGADIAAGYWGKPEESARVFGEHLRTGDLGFVLDGQLYVAGRIKDLIIAAGRNIYPQDVELTVEASHPAMRPGACAAFAVEVDGTEAIGIAAEIGWEYMPQYQPADAAERAEPLESIARTVRRAVVEAHECDVALLALLRGGSVPKTSSGKVQRAACRAAFRDGELDGVLLRVPAARQPVPA